MTDSNELRPSKEQMLHFYQQMLEIRRTEEQAAKAYTPPYPLQQPFGWQARLGSTTPPRATSD